MKKRALSAMLAVCMLICSLSAATAYAGTQEEVRERISGAADFLMSSQQSFDFTQSADYLTLLDSGYDMSDYNDAFLGSVVEQLKQNNGRLLSYGSEDLGVYACVISIADRLGIDAGSFYGYNLVERFNSLSDDCISNPYLYRVAIDIADDSRARLLCDKFIEDYYTMGQGMNYWGYSCDNTAVLLASIARYKEYYSEVVDDATEVIRAHTTENGCFYSAEYNDVSPDSTAMAIMAYSALGNSEEAYRLYDNLCAFEGSKKGVMVYYGSENYYSTKSALLAFEYLGGAAEAAPFVHKSHIFSQTSTTEPTCTVAGSVNSKCLLCDAVKSEAIASTGHSTSIKITRATTKKDGSRREYCTVCGEVISSGSISRPATVTLSRTSYAYNGKAKRPSVTVKDARGKKIAASNYTVSYSNNKNVGKATVTIAFKGNYSGRITKSFKIKPERVAVKSVKGIKRGFALQWKKTAQTSGYQLQYATDKGFTKNKKTIVIKDAKATKRTVKKLKSGKKYYARVRAYRTVGSEKYYSEWSDVKTVKAK